MPLKEHDRAKRHGSVGGEANLWGILRLWMLNPLVNLRNMHIVFAIADKFLLLFANALLTNTSQAIRNHALTLHHAGLPRWLVW